LTVYRISSSRFPADSSAGNAGRWNHKGVRVIYTASSLALCALEILASRAGELPDDYVSYPVIVPDSLEITQWSEAVLTPNWRANPHPAETRDLGSRWASELRSAVLSVPSAVIRSERNYILNPAHAEFSLIAFGEPEAFLWDDRLQAIRR
jgi:RES domain-containing protein